MRDGATALLVLVLWLSGCGRVNYDAIPPNGQGDGGAGDGRLADGSAGVLPDAGLPDTPFGPATLIAALDDNNRYDDATVTGDLLEMYYASSRSGGPGPFDIWRSSRASSSDPWGPPVLVPELSSSDGETDPEVSADGLTMWLSSDRSGATRQYELWVSTRPSRGAAWSTPIRVEELGTTDDEFAPTEVSDRTRLIFARLLERDEDLFEAVRATPADPFAPAVTLDELNTSSDDAQPSLTPNGLHLIFASNRPGGFGERDLYLASRANMDARFDPPVPIVELNSSAHDGGAWISADLRYVVFSSRRTGELKLYEARR